MGRLSWLCLLVVVGCADDAPTPADAGPDAAVDTAVDAAVDTAPPPPPMAEPGRHDVTLVDTRRVVPSDGLPVETTPQTSNNNLDVIRHDGRVYLAWRTAPDHFAGPETRIHVVSSSDEATWEFEASYSLGTDLREPRFLELDGSLFLYVSVLGTNRFLFEPMGVRVAERSADGSWSELEDIGMAGYIAWRTRTEGGAPYMTAYLGGEHIYLFDGEPLTVELRTTTDGRTWTPVAPGGASIYVGGGSESDFTLADDGRLFGVIRNEAGDDSGYGSEVCSAPASDITDWTCRIDPKKYDSPLMLWHDGEAYLIARRNVSATGNYDLMDPERSVMLTTIMYQGDYAGRPKRCALWRYVQDEDRIAFVMDLPSNGDTCFPAWLTSDDPNELIVYNYSSDIDAEPLAWARGQQGETYIYRHVLRFTLR